MSSVAVVAWVVSEPRKRVPIELIYAALRRVDHSVFWEVQIAVFILLLLYTFLRSESPCPKNYSGEDSFDSNKQLQVRDVRVEAHPRLHALVRVKIIKQDQRLERPAAQAEGGDWVEVGAISADPNACFLVWLRRLFALRPTAPVGQTLATAHRHRPTRTHRRPIPPCRLSSGTLQSLVLFDDFDANQSV